MSGHPDTGGGNSPGDAGFDGMADVPGGMFETDDRDSITGRDPMISDYSNQTAIVAKAADLVATAIKEIRKATLIEDLVFERLAVTERDRRGDMVTGSVRFAMKARGGTPPKRSRIWIDVPVTGGYMHPPASFQDSSGRSYALSREAIRDLVGAGYTDVSKMMKKFPTAELSVTDRTVLPSAPARNFFSMASRIAVADGQFQVVTYTVGSENHEIHRAGCSAIQRAIEKRGGRIDFTCDSLEEARTRLMGRYDENEVADDAPIESMAKVHNCVRTASRREARAEQYNVKWYSKGYDGNDRPMDDSYSSSFDANGMPDAMQIACGLGATAFPGTSGWRPTEDGEIASGDGNYSGVVYKTFEIDHPDHFHQLAALDEEAIMKKEVPGGKAEVAEGFDWSRD